MELGTGTVRLYFCEVRDSQDKGDRVPLRLTVHLH
jgi:hypothetical protein